MFDAIIRRGTLTAVIALIICVIGIVAATRIPVQMIPDLDVRTVSIRTSWAGATPQDIEKEILIEQEEYLRSTPSLQRLVAEARSGEARIEMEFPFDVDLTQTLIRINNALNQVPDYPENVDQPSVYATSFSQNAFMFFYAAPLQGNPRGLNMDMMRDYLDDYVRRRMESVNGVSEIYVGGGAERQVRVLLDPAALAAREITPGDVRTALRARNRDTSGGEIESGKRRYLLRTIGRFETMEDVENLIIRRDGDSVVRLHEIADVEFDHFEISSRNFINGDPVIMLMVRREAGSNVLDIKYEMLDEVAAINEEVLNPAGMRMALLAEDVAYVEASIENVWFNLGLGALLATAVMYWFLRSGRTTMLGVVGIPVCTIAAFLGLLIAGRTINVISLAGIAFAIGMTLDNSIVVLESIDLERRKGKDRFRAALDGVRAVWPAVIASTFTTILVFVPIVFIQEEAGQLYSDVAVAIAASILMSMLVAITIIPTAAARLRFEEGGFSGDSSDARWRERVAGGVRWLIEGTRRPLATVGIIFVASILIYVVLTPPAEYLPEGEEPKTFVVMNPPPGYNLEEMTRIGLEVQDYFMPFVGAPASRYASGEDAVPGMKYVNLGIEPQRLRIITEAQDISQLDDLMQAMTEKFESYPGMRAFAARGSIISSNQGGTRAVSLDISGPDLASIYGVASAAYNRAYEVFGNPRVQADPPTLTLSQPLVQIRPDWARAAELGVDAGDLGFSVAALSDGAYADEFFYGDDKIDIYFYGPDGVETELDGIEQIPLYTQRGGVVPIGSVAEFVETIDTSLIRRINGRRTVTLNVIPPPDVALETGVQRVKSELIGHLRTEGKIPADVTIDISGASDQLDATQAAIADNYLVAVIIVYLLLVAIFAHWGYPLLIMATIPLGLAGGILGLQLLNLGGAVLPLFGLQEIRQPFDMISMLGFLILMGTVVNNPILIVHRAMENVREGLDARGAVEEAVYSRLRPIMMSTVTTMCGLAPLVFMPGEGTELYRGVGAIVLFGILGAAAVSLTFLPALTMLVLSFGERRRAEAA